MTLLSVEDLSVTFDAEAGTVHAVSGIDFAVEQGETVCLVGESGSGKTVACESGTCSRTRRTRSTPSTRSAVR